MSGLKIWIAGGLMLVVMLAVVDRARSRPDDDKDVEAARARNLAAFQSEYLPAKPRLTQDHSGHWLAIVDGRLVPRDEQGAVHPVADLGECLEAARAVNPSAKHRYVFRVGEEGDLRFDCILIRKPGDPGNVVGAALRKSLGIRSTHQPAEKRVRWTRGERSKDFDGAVSGLIEIRLTVPRGWKSFSVRFVDSYAFSGTLLLEEATARRLRLERFEVPGRASHVDVRGRPTGRDGRRCLVRIRLPELAVNEIVPAVVWTPPAAKPPSPKRRVVKTAYYIPTDEEISVWIREKRETDNKMVTVEAGRYKLGDSSFPGNPERVVTLEKPFKIDVHEVSNHDWFLFLWATKDSNEYLAAAPIVMGEYDTDGWAKGGKAQMLFQYDYQTRAKHPVRSIGYQEAKAFCRFVRKRLPTADEWEIAARGPEGRRYPWGNRYTKADWKTRAWTSFLTSAGTPGHPDRRSIRSLKDTVPVDSMPEGRSWCGCYHMAGNVSEWTCARVRVSHGRWQEVPERERPWAQVVKGGNFFTRQKGSLSAQFFELIPDLVSDQFRVGFRCVRD